MQRREWIGKVGALVLALGVGGLLVGQAALSGCEAAVRATPEDSPKPTPVVVTTEPSSSAAPAESAEAGQGGAAPVARDPLPLEPSEEPPQFFRGTKAAPIDLPIGPGSAPPQPPPQQKGAPQKGTP